MRVRYRLPTALSAAALLLCPIAAAPLAAQDYRGALGLTASGMLLTDVQERVADPGLGPSFTGGLEVERWFDGGRAGLRLTAAAGMVPQRPDIRTFLGSADLTIRLRRATPGRSAAPYIALGGGAAHYDMTYYDASSEVNPMVGNPETAPIATAALGVDLGLRGRWGVRIEAADHVIFRNSPFQATSGDAIQPIHHLRLTTGLRIHLGDLAGRRRAPMASAEPEPEPEPTINPATAREFERLRGEVENLTRAVERIANTIDAERRSAPARRPRTTPGRGGDDLPSGTLYTIQVAAYADSQASDARAFAGRIHREHGLPVWVVPANVNGQTMRRIRVGVATGIGTVRRLGERLEDALGVDVWVAPLEARNAVPDNAIADTRAFLQGS